MVKKIGEINPEAEKSDSKLSLDLYNDDSKSFLFDTDSNEKSKKLLLEKHSSTPLTRTIGSRSQVKSKAK